MTLLTSVFERIGFRVVLHFLLNITYIIVKLVCQLSSGITDKGFYILE